MPFQSISSFSPSLYIYLRLHLSILSIVQKKSWDLLFAWNFYVYVSLKPLFRNREADVLDAYYDRMPNYSAVSIISITLINRAVSEWNVRDLCICNRPPCHQFAILIFTRASISRWPRSRDDVSHARPIKLNLSDYISSSSFFFSCQSNARQIDSSWKVINFFNIFFFSLSFFLSPR